MTIEYHEPPDELSANTRDLHRAFCVLVEELEAIDWYLHRLDVSSDDALRAVMAHNQREEFEHAAMALEYLRRQLPDFDHFLRMYLFTEAPLVEIEESAEKEDESGDDGSLGIARRMKGKAP